MGLIARLLGRKEKDDDRDDAERGVSSLQAATRDRTRRELIAMALRDTLKKHGLVDGCITLDALPGFTSTRHRGMHIQLVFRDWQPSLLAYVVALESAVKGRLNRLDPLSPSWITGVSWRFEPRDRTVWPRLPVPGETSVSITAARHAGSLQSADTQKKLLKSGDDAFMPTAHGQLVAAPDFSPTLPMRG
ncbi:hypothetical protein JJB11_10945 [Ramlibacter ginsenosidimutans]|uniref:Uncharacterized protein n=1 Tax=Ramlibacter ginsenosidimutans TaxID=502333 RepID=A0A934TTH0_9BURK|nr:hypothetical protein [Ramlibacter ginsenosidimutans]MBK6006610.1 hypothetical protein [Ramlibacter ginsenosidimutans]